jgi:steroid delta-isomerase-like uncharacterized protein
MNPETVVRTWFKEVWTEGQEEAIDRLLAVDAMIHDLPTPDGQPMRGCDAFKPFYRRFRTAFPDIRVEVLRTIADGELIAVHCQVTGRHGGDTLGIAATGRPVDFKGMAIARIRDGQIVEGWNCFDFLTLYQQVGMLPAMA